MVERINPVQSRRSLLGLAIRGAAVASLTEVIPSIAWASNVSVERAAVCIYLIGGNDSNNMIVPLDPASYSAYATGRGRLALPQNILLPVSASRQGGGFGLHPFLLELRDLYQQGALAVLANTGDLDAPVTQAQVRAKQGIPDGLDLHDRAAYTRYLPEGIMMEPWAPEIQEPSNNPRDPDTQVYALGGVSFMTPQRLRNSGPIHENPSIMSALKKTRLRTAFPNTSLGSQLERIARVMEASSQLGMSRPVFTATMPGFDTHRNEVEKQEGLYQELSQAMAAFYSATVEMGVQDQVVTYTQTEFNRTLLPNRLLGTEHAWGGHELIMGGSVRGGDIYGKFPSLELGGPDDAGDNGTWIPSVGNQQYAATIAYWHGVRNLPQAVPGIEKFSTANLEFLG